jgi:hypothetical protein
MLKQSHFRRILGARMMKPGKLKDATNLHQSIRRLVVAAAVVLSAFYQGASGADNHPALAPNQDFSNPLLQVRAPASEGWFGSERSANYIAFGKRGSNSSESFIAQVNLFRLPTFADSAAFTEYIREQVIKGAPTDRFETLESNVQYTAERGYPCVSYHAVSNDEKPRTSSFFRRTLRFEIYALYCQHPLKPGLGFMAAYSHRGGDIDAALAKEAADFIDSIQVTPHGAAPGGENP